DAPIERRGQSLQNPVHGLSVDVAKRRDPEMAAGLLALLSPSVVSAGGVLVARAGIDNGELGRRRERERPHRLIAHVDEQRFSRFAIDLRELIEDACARSLVLRIGTLSA